VIGLFTIIAVGFFLGMRHATDPDHVIAVTTIVSRQRNVWRAALTGIFWGIGHTLTIFIVGAGIILFNLVIPVRLGLSMEFSVSLMLILLGVINVVAFLRSMPGATTFDEHSHAHNHGGGIFAHSHNHLPQDHSHEPGQAQTVFLDRVFGRSGIYQHLRPLVIGLVHGLAGSAAVALLVLTTISNPHWALAYLLLFGVGTIAGMMLITMSIASTFHFVGRNREGFSRRLGLASGLISLVFGLFVAYEICFVQGLLSGHPHWTPH
jgi:high-affinity nickel permease